MQFRFVKNHFLSSLLFLTVFAVFSQQSIVDANVTANYNNALNLYNNKAYAAAQKIFKTVEEKTKINSALKVDALLL